MTTSDIFTSPNFKKMQPLLAALIAFIIVFWQMQDNSIHQPQPDSYVYMSIAKNLVDTGVFTDGRFHDQAAVHGSREQGMFFAPLYPAFLAGMMLVDSDLYNSISCYELEQRAGDIKNCPTNFKTLLWVQALIASASAFLVWFSAKILTNRHSIAWIAMLLSLSAEAYAYYAGNILTEGITFLLFTASCLAATLAWQYKKKALWFITGALIASTALTRPSFVYLFYMAIPLVWVLCFCQKEKKIWQTLSWPMMLVLGYFLIAGPWMVRNGTILGDYAISRGYAPFILIQRVAFNTMNWNEWKASFIYGLPDFGDSLAEKLFPAEDYERLSYSNPDGFYLTGIRRLKVSSEEGALSDMIKNDIMGNLYKHTMTTISLAWRGMWVSKYWGLITIPIFIGVFIIAVKRKWTDFLIFSIPPWFMLGFHAFTSVNVVRYNLVMIPCLAIAAALFLNACTLYSLKCLKKDPRHRGG